MEDDDTAPLEELTSRTENDLLSSITDHLSDMSGMSLQDLRHLPSDTYHSGTRQQNGNVATGRPQSFSELPSNDALTQWTSSLIEHDEIRNLNFNRATSTDTS